MDNETPILARYARLSRRVTYLQSLPLTIENMDALQSAMTSFWKHVGKYMMDIDNETIWRFDYANKLQFTARA